MKVVILTAPDGKIKSNWLGNIDCQLASAFGQGRGQ
jgi:hypothetical protein